MSIRTNDVITKNTRKKPNKSIKPKNKNKKKIVFLSIGLFILFVISLGCGYVYYDLSRVNTIKISHKKSDLGISDDIANKVSKMDNAPLNIALFGVDSRDKNGYGNSDTIMIASVDKANKKIKLISIMRDSRVPIDGHGLDKINAAYCIGGPQLAIKTINKNFGMDIKDFVTVNFFDLEKIIDDLGGVSINVTKDEIPYINASVQEISNIEKKKMITVKNPGLQNLTGSQAVGYSRIRYIGNDQQRTERQRTVLTALLNKIQAGGVSSYPSNVSKLLPYVETSYSSFDILKIGKDVLTSGTKNIVQTRIPLDSYLETPTIGGQSFVTYDIGIAKDQIYKFVYDDLMPQEKK